MPVKLYYFLLGKILLFSVLILGTEGIVVVKYLEESFLSIFLLGGICAAVYCGIILFIGFTETERNYLVDFVRRRGRKSD